MSGSNNVVSMTDWKSKKDPVQKQQLEKAREAISNAVVPKAEQLEEQPKVALNASEDNYTKFVTDPQNANKIEFVISEMMKSIALQYPNIITCRFGDVLFLKEGVVSLIMRSSLGQEHPFQKMADNLEIIFNRNERDSTK